MKFDEPWICCLTINADKTLVIAGCTVPSCKPADHGKTENLDFYSLHKLRAETYSTLLHRDVSTQLDLHKKELRDRNH